MNPKIIKSSKFEDGTFAIKAPVHPLPLINDTDADGTPVVDGRVSAAQAQAQSILEAAREQAASLLTEAREALDREVADAQARLVAHSEQVLAEAREAGHAEGVAAGEKAGHEAVLAAFADQIGQLQAACEAAHHERQGWFEANEKELVKLSLLIAQKILVLELATSRESVLKMTEAALRHVTDKTQVRVRLHPRDLPLVTAAKAQLMLGVDSLASLELVADPTVGLGGCTIDTRTGTVDARVSTQLAEVAASLLDLAPGPDGTTDLDPLIAAAIRSLGEGGHVLTQAPQAAPAAWAPPARMQPAEPPTAAPEPPSMPVQEMEATVPQALPPALPEPVFAAPPIVEVPVWEPPVLQVAPPAPAVVDLPEPEAPEVYEDVDPEPELAPEVTSAQPTPAPSAPMARRPLDPSKRAAAGLAARLGQKSRGRTVTTMTEEYDMSKFDGVLSDDALETIIKQVLPTVPVLGVEADEPLVPGPQDLRGAAERLADRLGQKRKRPNVRDAADEPTASQLEELDAALSDARIDQIMGSITMQVAREGDDEAVDESQPDIDRASADLSKLLGQKKKKSNRAWYDQ